MKIVKNADGTVTVSIPKADELYDPELGGLHLAETLSAEDFEAALHPPKDAKEPTDAEKAKAIADEESRLDTVAQAERDRHAAEAASHQLAVDRVQSQVRNDQLVASEKARLSLAANARIARDREDAAIVGGPLTPAGTGAEKASAGIHATAEAVGTSKDDRPTQKKVVADAAKAAKKSPSAASKRAAQEKGDADAAVAKRKADDAAAAKVKTTSTAPYPKNW